MFYSSIATTLIAVATLLTLPSLYNNVQNLRRNLTEAKSTGFKYVITPVHPISISWLLLKPVLVPILRCSPKAWTAGWLELLETKRHWHSGYEPFRALGADTFVAVSPGGNILHTCDPDVSTQLLRGSAYGKPAELLNILNIFGPTMTGTDGAESKLSRRIVTPFFNGQTYNQVWTRSIRCAEGLCEVFSQQVPRDLRSTLARATLHVLNATCFEKTDDELIEELRFQERVPTGHEISYADAMSLVLDYFETIFLTPPLALNYSPLGVHRRARQAYRELRGYMEEIRESKKQAIDNKYRVAEPSLLDMIVKGGQSSTSSPALLGPASILGNIFIFMFAGHEANANTLTFILVLLALHPTIQASLQSSISTILSSRHPSQWNYEKDYHALMSSYTGAVVNEALRLFTVLPFLPKKAPSTPQSIMVTGAAHTIPANMLILINTSATHRNPRYWPEPTKFLPLDGEPHPVTAFNPDLWLQDPASLGGGGIKEPATGFLRPKAGSFIPFSDGSRGCLGQRFALVELCAVVARIFSEYSVELDVDNIEKGMPEEDIRAQWESAKLKATREMSSGVEFNMSLRLTGKVPLKLVRRGEETFRFFA